MKTRLDMGTDQVPQMTHPKYMGSKYGSFYMICPISRYVNEPLIIHSFGCCKTFVSTLYFLCKELDLNMLQLNIGLHYVIYLNGITNVAVE